MAEIEAWTVRVAGKAQEMDKMRQKQIIRFEGRTFKETWAKPPVSYMRISSNGGYDFPLGLNIMRFIEQQGRMTIDEIAREFGAVDKEPLAVAVNALRYDHYLKDHTENDEEKTQTFELLEE